jgi:protein-tyrosine phosphatase
MKLIDIHSHVLPFIDDGAEDWDMAMQMMRQAEKDGIDSVVCTPHILSEKEFKNEAEIYKIFTELRQKVTQKGISVNLELGSEIYVQPYIPFEQKIATLAQNGRYFLIEFPLNLTHDFLFRQFFDTLAENRIPVIAHPERYAYIQSKPERAYEFVKRGALLQLNAGSLMGVFGQYIKELSFRLVDANLVHVIGSDAHDLKTRPLKLSYAYQFVANRWGTEKANELFYLNPTRILAGETIYVDLPVAFSADNKSVKSKLGKFIRALRRD